MTKIHNFQHSIEKNIYEKQEFRTYNQEKISQYKHTHRGRDNRIGRLAKKDFKSYYKYTLVFKGKHTYNEKWKL